MPLAIRRAVARAIDEPLRTSGFEPGRDLIWLRKPAELAQFVEIRSKGTRSYGVEVYVSWCFAIPRLAVALGQQFANDPASSLAGRVVDGDLAAIMPEGRWAFNAPRGRRTGSYWTVRSPDEVQRACGEIERAVRASLVPFLDAHRSATAVLELAHLIRDTWQLSIQNRIGIACLHIISGQSGVGRALLAECAESSEYWRPAIRRVAEAFGCPLD